MTSTFPIRFDGAHLTTGVRLERTSEVPAGLAALGLDAPRPVVVLIGGAGGLDDRDIHRLRPLFTGLVDAIVRYGAATLDGGTLSGVMRLVGDAYDDAAAATPLVGVAAIGTVTLPGGTPPRDDAAPLEPHHTHFVLVPGDDWGAEASWIASIATVLAGTMPSATVLVNGGEVAYRDVERSLGEGRPVLTVEGSGRTADELATSLRGEPADPRAVRLAASGLVEAVPPDNPTALGQMLTKLFDAVPM